MTDAENIAHHIALVAATADLYPGVVIIFTADIRQVLYMSERGLNLLGTTLPELTALGEAYYPRYFNPEEAQDYVPRVLDMLERNDPSHWVAFFQQVRTGPGGTYELYLSTVRVLAQDAAGKPLLNICIASLIDRHSHLTAKVARLLEENHFLRAHAPTFANLSGRERQVLRGMALGKAASEIADELFISSQTVETHRRNLRRKLGITSSFELSQYARAFDLI